MMSRQMPPSRTRSRQRGFVLIIVFLVVLLLVSLSTNVLLSTQSDLQVAGHDRESLIALYAAEAGLAFATDWLSSRADSVGPGAWDTVLGSGHVYLCVPNGGARPGTVPRNDNLATSYDLPRSATYRFCIHNNAFDRGYFEAIPLGDVADSDGIITVESYGTGPNGARRHLTIELRAGTVGAGTDAYHTEGGGPTGTRGGPAVNPIQNNTTSLP